MLKPTPEQIKSWIKKNFGSDYKTAKSGSEIRINNPLSIDNGYHLWINLRKSVVNDFRPNYKSGTAGSFLSFVMKYRGSSFKEAAREVMGKNISFNKQNVFDEKDDELVNVKIKLPDGFQNFTYNDNTISSVTKKYLNKRCISNGKIYVNKMGYCGTDVVFPYYEFCNVVYWQQRSITSKMFLFPEGANKSNYLYGIDNIDPTDPVIITESIINSLMFDNAVAVGGSDLSEEQKLKLKKHGVKRIILAFDNDGAGRIGITKAFKKLEAYFDLYYSLTDSEPDWNDVAIECGIEEPLKMLKRNIKKLDFKEIVKLKIL